MKYCKVLIPVNLDKNFIYTIPEDLQNAVERGSIVTVHFRGRQTYGLVMETMDNTDIRNVKPIESIHLSGTCPEKYIELIEWIARYYLSTMGSVLRNILPSLTKNIKRYAYRSGENPALEIIKEETMKKPLSRTAMTAIKGINAGTIDRLIEEGSIEESVFAYNPPRQFDVQLNSEQEEAYNAVLSSLGTHRSFLLYGPPSSGKSEVFIKLMQSVIDNTDKNVLLLLPEIGLAGIVYKRILRQFGQSDTALIHSELSDGERYHFINEISKGSKRIVVGTRSAVFAPLSNIGLVIIDEEQDLSFKQTDSAPNYNGRDSAIYAARIHSAPALLVSATPSIESWYNARNDKYTLLELKHKFIESPKPDISIIRKDIMPGHLSVQVTDKIADNLRNKKQTIIFLNRRGYMNLYICSQCGEYYKCPDCSVSLSYHRDKHQFICHYCGRTEDADAKCPHCGGALRTTGVWGTQKIEELIGKMYRQAHIERLDLDAAAGKGKRMEVIQSMIDGRTDILIGTQIVSKGYDIPGVHTVIMFNADSTVNMPDFRSEEYFMQLLVQTAGRAGRRQHKGEILIETMGNLEHLEKYIYDLDYRGFLDRELERRKSAGFPPFRRMLRVMVKDRSKDKALKAIGEIHEHFQRLSADSTDIFPPVPMIVEKVAGKYRYHFFVFYENFSSVYPIVRALQKIRRDFTVDNW
ncbi:MAG: primosomal protein N' [candidate division WOR-3 bacterium]|nr:primosomal protein N' [candidate division WOR-3 bacterium]